MPKYILSLILIITFSTAQGQIKEPDFMPYFPGCEDYAQGTEKKRACSDELLLNYINKNLVVPEEAEKLGLEGVVYLGFSINEDGRVVMPKVYADIGGGCGNSVVQLFENMPPWESAILDGINISTQLFIPIKIVTKTKIAFKNDFTVYWGNNTSNEISVSNITDLIQHDFQILDSSGAQVEINDFVLFSDSKKQYQRGRNGRLNKAMKKFLSKLKSGDSFSVTFGYAHQGEAGERTFSYMIKR